MQLSVPAGTAKRFLLLLCGDIERNPGPKRGKMNLNIGFVKATSERMIKMLGRFSTVGCRTCAVAFRSACSRSSGTLSDDSGMLSFSGFGFHFDSMELRQVYFVVLVPLGTIVLLKICPGLLGGADGLVKRL